MKLSHCLIVGLYLVTAPRVKVLAEVELNDVHSRLNATLVAELVSPRSTGEVVKALLEAKKRDLSVSISGAKHSMGGQQFAKGSLHLDMRSMNRVLELDADRLVVRAEAGITWTALLVELEKRQPHGAPFLTIRQKQTGADELTLGGAVSSNIHGRGLNWQPMVQDIESLTLVTATGEVVRASRDTQPELFRLVVGGYGLFGVITEVELRLMPRQRLERVVEITSVSGLQQRIEQRRREGFWLGDFMIAAAAMLREEQANVIYGTVRFIKQDTESFFHGRGEITPAS